MDNQKVRSYLRKGELAAALLETLGYSYEEKSYAVPKWVEPTKQDPIKALSEKFEAELLKPMIEQLQALAKANVCPVTIGTCFTITGLPAGHFLKGYRLPPNQVFVVEEIKRIKAGTPQADHLGYVGLAISFDVNMGISERRLWLPLDCIKVTADARF